MFELIVDKFANSIIKYTFEKYYIIFESIEFFTFV